MMPDMRTALAAMRAAAARSRSPSAPRRCSDWALSRMAASGVRRSWPTMAVIRSWSAEARSASARAARSDSKSRARSSAWAHLRESDTARARSAGSKVRSSAKLRPRTPKGPPSPSSGSAAQAP